ncbi:MAG: adenylosuccinate lyase [Cyanobacteria bacterium SIG30]|nr:adenylosuccinate lyase [Cyanobacteria bacterium SIG30]
MIERYSREKISKIWDLESKFRYYLNVEIAVCEAYCELGKIPNEALEHIKKTANFTVDRIAEIEKTTNHDVIAFLTNVNENVGVDYSRYIHMGLTSSDVIDTAFALQIKDAASIILEDLDVLLNTIKKMALEHKETVCMGRSHGIGAEVTTFGFKLLNWYDMFERAKIRLEKSLDDILVGQMSGPVGTYSNITPDIEKLTCKKLGLKQAKISTQVISRDRHSDFINSLAILASVIENSAVEIRHLQRWEVAEVEEGFKKGQKGSSAMPHKKNPISSENLTGLARLVRANAISALENITLWHERDISHSSVERVIFPDSTILIDFMLNRLNNVLENLVIKKENMIKNTEKYGGIIYSQNALLLLTQKGMTREDAYKIVQKEAFEAFENGADFKECISKYLTEDELKNCFNREMYLQNIEKVFARFDF